MLIGRKGLMSVDQILALAQYVITILICNHFCSCACVRACVRARARVCVFFLGGGGGGVFDRRYLLTE